MATVYILPCFIELAFFLHLLFHHSLLLDFRSDLVIHTIHSAGEALVYLLELAQKDENIRFLVFAFCSLVIVCVHQEREFLFLGKLFRLMIVNRFPDDMRLHAVCTVKFNYKIISAQH